MIADVEGLASAREGQASEVETEIFVSRAPETAAERVLVLPISSGTQIVGALVAGVSRFLRLAGDYRDFFDLAAARVSAAIANARAYEEERRRAEALAELDRAKTAFFSNVSHEFRTPLTLMLGPVEDVLAKPAEQLLPEHRELLTVAQRNGLRLQKLVNTLLDFSRIEAGRVQAAYEPTDLADDDRRAGQQLPLGLRAGRARARRGLPAAARTRLRRPRDVGEDRPQPPLQRVQVHLRGRDRRRLRPAAGGRGAGGPRHRDRHSRRGVPHVFERFHRVEDARGRTHEGTGIGLALVQELVKLHGGSVAVESAPGRGSTFTVSIPTGKAHLPAERIGRRAPWTRRRWVPDPTSRRRSAGSRMRDRSRASRRAGSRPDASSPSPSASTASFALPATERETSGRARILWADDNADMRDYVRRLLSARYDVETVADGQAALAAVRARRPDLVLADVMMPKLDGFGLLRALRADPATRSLPVILLSARAGEEARIEGLEAGADAYLVKPFSARELLAYVSTRLELGRLRARLERARARAEKANRAKDEFLATLSHELRTPLNAMLGWVRLLQSGALDEAAARAGLEVVDRNVNLQAKLITDLLDISRIISGKLTLELPAVDLTAVVASAVETMRPSAEAKGVTLVTTLAPGSISVLGDGERLQQVVEPPVERDEVHSDGRPRDGPARTAAIGSPRCQRHGQGYRRRVPPSRLRAFRQADGSSTRADAGLGLGLAIVRHIVELHQGSVRAESAGEGKGATFTVDLPIAPPAAARRKARSTSAARPGVRERPEPARRCPGAGRR